MDRLFPDNTCLYLTVNVSSCFHPKQWFSLPIFIRIDFTGSVYPYFTACSLFFSSFSVLFFCTVVIATLLIIDRL